MAEAVSIGSMIASVVAAAVEYVGAAESAVGGLAMKGDFGADSDLETGTPPPDSPIERVVVNCEPVFIRATPRPAAQPVPDDGAEIPPETHPVIDSGPLRPLFGPPPLPPVPVADLGRDMPPLGIAQGNTPMADGPVAWVEMLPVDPAASQAQQDGPVDNRSIADVLFGTVIMGMIPPRHHREAKRQEPDIARGDASFEDIVEARDRRHARAVVEFHELLQFYLGYTIELQMAMAGPLGAFQGPAKAGSRVGKAAARLAPELLSETAESGAKALVRAGDAEAANVVVELGAGDLNAALRLARRPGRRVIAVDPFAEPTEDAVRALERSGGQFLKGSPNSLPDGSADNVIFNFPHHADGIGRQSHDATWRLVDDALRLLRPDGSAFLVTEDLQTARFLARTAADRGAEPLLFRTTAREAAPTASGAGIPNFSPNMEVYVVYFVKSQSVAPDPVMLRLMGLQP